MSVTVRYLDVPEGAQQSAQATGDVGQSFSDFAGIISGVQDIPYATLEPTVWVLDGSRRMIPDNPTGMGWWSAVRSGTNGRFSEPPTISITLSAVYAATGLTFMFSPSTDQWCSELAVKWYNGQLLMAEVTAFPDEPEWILEHLVDSFDRIEIQLLATNQPGQFAKLQMIQIGKVVVFGRNELTRVRLTNEVDPSICVLSVDTMRVEIRDRKGRTFLPQENQRMELYKDEKLLASHYIMDSRREAKFHYTFSCRSAIGLLMDEYLGGMYTAVPIRDVLDDILDGRPYILDESFAKRTVTGYLPICTRREALQQVAFMLGAMVTTQGMDAICLLPLPNQISGTFADKDIFPGAKAETQPRISKIELVAHSYTKSSEIVTLMSSKDVDGEAVLFTFYEPHYDYSVEGGTIVDSGVNWVKITASGQVTLHAKTYLHNTAVYSKQNPLATVAERNNVLTVDSVTLLNRGNVQAVLDRFYAAKLLRQTVTQEVVITGQKAGDRVSTVHPWGEYTTGFVTSMESTLTQSGHTAMVEILGKEEKS